MSEGPVWRWSATSGLRPMAPRAVSMRTCVRYALLHEETPPTVVVSQVFLVPGWPVQLHSHNQALSGVVHRGVTHLYEDAPP